MTDKAADGSPSSSTFKNPLTEDSKPDPLLENCWKKSEEKTKLFDEHKKSDTLQRTETKVIGEYRKSDTLKRSPFENLKIRASALESIPVVAALIAGFDVSLIIFVLDWSDDDVAGWCQAVLALSATSLMAAIGVITETSLRSFYWTRLAVHDTMAADAYMSETSWHDIRNLQIGYMLSATLSAGLCVALSGLSFWPMVATVSISFVIGIPNLFILCKLFFNAQQWISTINLQFSYLKSVKRSSSIYSSKKQTDDVPVEDGGKRTRLKLILRNSSLNVSFEEGSTYFLSGQYLGETFEGKTSKRQLCGIKVERREPPSHYRGFTRNIGDPDPIWPTVIFPGNFVFFGDNRNVKRDKVIHLELDGWGMLVEFFSFLEIPIPEIPPMKRSRASWLEMHKYCWFCRQCRNGSVVVDRYG